MHRLPICVAIATLVCASAAPAQLRITDLPPAMRPAASPKLTPPHRVMPSAPMTASSILTRVSPALSVSAPQRSLGVVIPDANLGAPRRVVPSVTAVVPTASAPDPIETRKSASILPIENARMIQVRRAPMSESNRPCPATKGNTKKACK